MPSLISGWVLYDGSCGICSRWVARWKGTLARLGLEIAPLQEAWVREQLNAQPGELLSDIRILFTDGRQLLGADAYRWVLRRLWWTWPLYLLAVAPGTRWIFDRVYRAFANRRMHVARACGVGPKD